jgi:hypothetical protein
MKGEGSVSEGWKKLPQEEAGHEQEGQGNAQQQYHLKQRLPTTQRIGRNQITYRFFSGRWLLAAAFAPLSSGIRQGFPPIEEQILRGSLLPSQDPPVCGSAEPVL